MSVTTTTENARCDAAPTARWLAWTGSFIDAPGCSIEFSIIIRASAR